MKNHINNFYDTCEKCQTNRREKLKTRPIPISIIPNLQPMQEINADFFQLRASYYLVEVDRFSGYIWCQECSQQSTAEAIRVLESIWDIHGLSKEVRTDSGPAFRTNFKRSLRALGIDLVHSSEYFLQGNRLAERAVGEVKKYLHKVGNLRGSKLQKVMFTINNQVSSVEGLGSAFMRFFERTPYTGLPWS